MWRVSELSRHLDQSGRIDAPESRLPLQVSGSSRWEGRGDDRVTE